MKKRNTLRSIDDYWSDSIPEELSGLDLDAIVVNDPEPAIFWNVEKSRNEYESVSPTRLGRLNRMLKACHTAIQSAYPEAQGHDFWMVGPARVFSLLELDKTNVTNITALTINQIWLDENYDRCIHVGIYSDTLNLYCLPSFREDACVLGYGKFVTYCEKYCTIIVEQM